MAFNWIPFLTYALITTYTPGPNNISTATFSMNLGYKKTMKYMLGISTGFFLLMFAAGYFTELIINAFPKFEVILRYIGAAYILWLAYSVFKSSKKSKKGDGREAKFISGFFLQLMNPKVILYAVSIFAGFLNPVIDNVIGLIFISFLLTINACISLNVWAVFGAGIKKFVKNERTNQIINIVMAVLLVFCALTIVFH
ncbi:MAG: LysE family translocator [Nanoarchaeota archaeon]|nr:LysE family translocator [Nanoarchaeota archaeon]